MEDLLLRAQQMKTSLDKVSKSFCLAKWLQTTLLMQNGTTQSCHHVLCHKIDAKPLKKNPSALHNTKFKKRMRGYMIAGLKPEECAYCWNLENVSQLSDRAYKSSSYWAKPFFDKVIQTGAFGNIDPSYLEIAFSNKCPLKCAYCTPLSSSSWRDEIEKFGHFNDTYMFGSMWELVKMHAMPFKDDEPNPYLDAFWEWWPSLRPNLQCFRITGGEPLIHDSTWRVIDDLAANPTPELIFEINSSLAVGSGLIDKMIDRVNGLSGKIKEFLLHVSIDTVGTQAEYLRFGLSYPRFLENVENFLARTEGAIKLNYMITINALSITGMKKLLEIIIDQRKRYPEIPIYLDQPYLRNPFFMSLQILTSDFRKYFEEILDFMRANSGPGFGFKPADIAKFERIYRWAYDPKIDLNWLNKMRKDFLLIFTEYDKRRNTNFLEAFPEYREFWAFCKSL